MRSFLSFAFLISFACQNLLVSSFVDGQDTPADPPELIVYVVRNEAASDLAKTLNELFDGEERLRIVAEMSSNVLLIRSPKELRESILQILQEIDRPAKAVAIDIQFIRAVDQMAFSPDFDQTGPIDNVQALLTRLQKNGVTFETQRVALTSIENQKAMVQIGKQSPILSGSTSSNSRARVNQYLHLNSGTLLAITHRVAENRIVLDLQFESSEIHEDTEEDENGPRPSSITTTTVQTTIELNSGESYVLNATSSRGAGPLKAARLIVNAKILSPAQRKVRQAVQPIDVPVESANRKVSDRYQKYAAAMIERYDVDADRKLDGNEIAKMQRKMDGADADGDGFVSELELVNFYMKN